MTCKILFSVLIANYNNGKSLMNAVESVRRQTYTNWEIVIVDDGSTDDSAMVYQKLIDDKHVRIFYNGDNYGCGYTKRRCAELALGDICGFLDPDDTLVETALEKHVEAHQNEQVSIVYSKAHFCTPDGRFTGDSCLPDYTGGKTYFDYRTWGSMHFTSFKRNAYLKTEGINPQLKAGVDQDLYFRLEEVGFIYPLDEFCYNWVNSGNDHSVSCSSQRNYIPLWYWNMVARYDTCVRRGLSKDILLPDFKRIVEDYANMVAFQREQKIRSSKAYRIGKVISKLFQWLRFWGDKND